MSWRPREMATRDGKKKYLKIKRSVPCVPILALLAVPAKLSCPTLETNLQPLVHYWSISFPTWGSTQKEHSPDRPFIYIHIKLVIKTDNFIFPPQLFHNHPRKVCLNLATVSASEKLQSLKHTFPILLNLWLLMIFFFFLFFFAHF